MPWQRCLVPMRSRYSLDLLHTIRPIHTIKPIRQTVIIAELANDPSIQQGIPPSMKYRAAIRQGARIIRNGGLVGFPTETVYGLGADATNASAVDKIYRVKGRPREDPLIVHLGSVDDLAGIADDESHIMDTALELAGIYWPGALTMILSRKEGAVASEVSAGRNTVAVRMPDHPVALALIRAAGVPIAAPSANRFGHISPTTGEHVISDLGNEIDMLIDTGHTRIGVESTVVDLTASAPTVLRPGGVTIEELRRTCPSLTYTPKQAGDSSLSPGNYLRHYSPHTPLVIVDDLDVDAGNRSSTHVTEVMSELVGSLSARGLSSTVIATFPEQEDDLRNLANNLYSYLHTADAGKGDIILAGFVRDEGIGTAINDRLFRAAAGRVVRDASPTTVDFIVDLVSPYRIELDPTD